MEREKALEDLHVIRKIMADTLSVMVLSGWQGIGWGVLFLLGGLVTHIYGISPGVKSLWIFIVVFGSIIESFFYVRKAIRENLPLFSPLTRHLTLGFGPIILTGAVFHWIFVKLDVCNYIPGSWMLIWSIGCVFAGLFSLGEFLVLGIMLFIGGILAVGPMVEQSFLVTAILPGFGGIVWGLWVNRRLGG